MTFLPIVERELRVASRRSLSYWARVGGASAALALGIALYWFLGSDSPEELGMALLAGLGGLQFVYCLMAGVRWTADSLSVERREDTLGLLFLTDLRGYDVVLGKLMAGSVSAFYQLLAALPLLGLPLLLGGVEFAQFLKVALALVAAMFLSLATGMGVSVWFRDGRKAALITAAALAGLCVAPWLPMAGSTITVATGAGTSVSIQPPVFDYARALLPLSPPFTLISAFGSPRSALGNLDQAYWVGLSVMVGLGLLSLVLASFVLPRIWREDGSPVGRRFRDPLGAGVSKRGSSPPGAFRGRDLLDVNPFLWLASRDWRRPLYLWILLGAAAVIGGWGHWRFGRDWINNLMDLALSMVLHLSLKCWIAFAVVQRLADDKRSGALELLLCTPLTSKRIQMGQYLAIWRQFAAPIAVVLLADVVFSWLAAQHAYSDRALTAVLYGARILMLPADALTLVWLGMWTALTTGKAGPAALRALFRVLVLPWLVLLAGLAVFLTRRRYIALDDTVLVMIWLGVGLANNCGWFIYARKRLGGALRHVAAEPSRAEGWLRTVLGGG